MIAANIAQSGVISTPGPRADHGGAERAKKNNPARFSSKGL